MDLFTPSVWDRLLSDDPGGARRSIGAHGAALRRAVLQDLERLMNARVATDLDAAAYPQANRSVLNYGVRDFSSLSPANPSDVQAICDCILASISRNDQRLKHVRVEVEGDSSRGATSLSFVLRAMLVLCDYSEPVSFQAAFDSKRRAFSLSATSPGGE
jgi:type VI secretion system protein ImpF